MFAYCRNNPVKRKDASGTEDLCVTDGDDDESPIDDVGISHGGGGISGGNSSGGIGGGYTYSSPPGGGGVSTQVQVGDTTVTFGHGGGHMGGSNIADIENFIANDVVKRPPSTSAVTHISVVYSGRMLDYGYFTRSSTLINVGTYYFL